MAEGVKIRIFGDTKDFESALKGLGAVATKSIKLATGAVIAGAAAVTTLATLAVKGFAEYEQLVGGVDTLFKTSSQQVQEYANEAYKTAGMSANKYMETVTSFSASLLQSLGGDTKKAAEAGNQAIIDMSDNANKMGTSIEMIQNAYQGFAKQNYTMLDNLKLGYGGTKTEMERLLVDAERLSGIKYDIDNLNDVYSAIHVIQTELGITGTTALEAGSTIQGSFSATKSAFDNLVVGLADKNSDIDLLISNLIDSIGVFGENILPVIETAIGGIAKLIEKIAPEIASKVPSLINQVLPPLLSAATSIVDVLVAALPSLLNTFVPTIVSVIATESPKLVGAGISLIESLVKGIQDNLPQFADGAIEIIRSLVDGVMKLLPAILQLSLDLIITLAQGLVQYLPELIPVAYEVVYSLVEQLLNNADMLIDVAIDLTIVLADGLIAALPIVMEKAPIIIGKLSTAIINSLPKLGDAAFKLIIKLGEFIVVYGKNLPKYIADLWNVMAKAFNECFSAVGNIGKGLVEGLWGGIGSMTDWIKGKISGFSADIVAGIKNFFKINSPSRLMRDEVGKQIALGVAVGIGENANEAVNAVTDLAKATYSASSEWINARKKANELSLAEEYQAWQRVQSRYAEGTEQRISAEKEVERVKKEITTEIEKIEQEYANAVEQRANQIFNAFSLFDTVEPFEKVESGDLLNALTLQVKALETWSRDVQELSKRGIDEGLLAELEKMGPKATGQIQALLKMSEPELQKYSDLYKKKTELARTQAEKELEGMKKKSIQQTAELIKGVENEFSVSPIVGKNMTDGLARGILGGMSNVIQAAIAVARAAIEAAKDELDINSPSKEFEKIGLYTGEGFGLGTKKSLSQVKSVIGSELMDTVNNVKSMLNASQYTPMSAISSLSKAITTTNTTTNAPTLVFNEPVNTPDVVARRVNQVMTFGLAGAR